jgi:hypothetical protein
MLCELLDIVLWGFKSFLNQLYRYTIIDLFCKYNIALKAKPEMRDDRWEMRDVRWEMRDERCDERWEMRWEMRDAMIDVRCDERWEMWDAMRDMRWKMRWEMWDERCEMRWEMWDERCDERWDERWEMWWEMRCDERCEMRWEMRDVRCEMWDVRWEMRDAMRSPFQAKHINENMFIEDLSMWCQYNVTLLRLKSTICLYHVYCLMIDIIMCNIKGNIYTWLWALDLTM